LSVSCPRPVAVALVQRLRAESGRRGAAPCRRTPSASGCSTLVRATVIAPGRCTPPQQARLRLDRVVEPVSYPSGHWFRQRMAVPPSSSSTAQVDAVAAQVQEPGRPPRTPTSSPVGTISARPVLRVGVRTSTRYAARSRVPVVQWASAYSRGRSPSAQPASSRHSAGPGGTPARPSMGSLQVDALGTWLYGSGRSNDSGAKSVPPLPLAVVRHLVARQVGRAS